MSEQSSSPEKAADGTTNVHSVAPSDLPPSAASEVADAPTDAETLEALAKSVEQEHVPHIGATG